MIISEIISSQRENINQKHEEHCGLVNQANSEHLE